MKVRDIMSTDPISVRGDTLLKEAARIMVRHKVSGLPVIDERGHLIGIVTEDDFLRREASRDLPNRLSLLDALFGDGEPAMPVAETVAEVMTTRVVTIGPEAEIGEAARLMASRNVKRLPVVGGDGLVHGIISRADIVNAFTKPDDVIEDEVREDIIRRLLFLDPETVAVTVADGVVHLSGELENRSEVHLLEELTRRIAGVVKVDSEVTYQIDDRKTEGSGPL
ncbi:MAG: CBS domain-containing protein [Actinobacteria bacterium]|nr:CBS domain-containing protein [Actinomycetota bacterium]MBU1494300.1 CBS domain-containing protein [Actinomycetota bacterium]MBU1865458.1 CBS domain-containing protein [Actinomycetota bacterium]